MTGPPDDSPEPTSPALAGEWTLDAEADPEMHRTEVGAAAWDGDRLVYGGGVGPTGARAGDVFALEHGEWRLIGQLSEPREHLGAASDGYGRVWFMGGRTFIQVECLDLDGKVTVLPELEGGRHGIGAAELDEHVYAVLGGPQPGFSYSGAVQILDLASVTL